MFSTYNKWIYIGIAAKTDSWQTANKLLSLRLQLT